MKHLFTCLATLLVSCVLALSVAAEPTVDQTTITVIKNGKTNEMINPGDTFSAVLNISDPDAPNYEITSAYANSGSFTFQGEPVIEPVVANDTRTGFKLEFKNITYNGYSSTDGSSSSEPGFNLNVTYKLNGTTTTKSLPLKMPQCNLGSVPTATPAPTTTPAPTVPPYATSGAYIIAATVTNQAGGEIAEVKWNERMNVVLRVADYTSARTHLTENIISARVNSTTFTFTGNAEVSQLNFCTDDYGNNYYSYVLLFRDVIYNGTTGDPKFNINLSYLDSSLAMQQASVTLGQCSLEDPEDPNKVRTSGLVVRDVDYGGAAVTSGAPFVLNLGVYSTTGTEPLNDVIVALSLPEGVNLSGGTLSQFLGDMNAKSTRQASFVLTATNDVKNGVASITVNMSAVGATSGKGITGTTAVAVPITQPDRFTLGTLTTDEVYYAGSTGTVSLQFINKSQSAAGNLEATISGSNFTCDESYIYLGNINAGTENSVDFDITPGTEGPASGVITINYELSNGEQKTVTQSFSFDVQESPSFDMSDFDQTPAEPEKKGPGLWVYIGGGVAALLAIIFGVRFLRKRKKAKEMEALDTDDPKDADDEDEEKPENSNDTASTGSAQ